MPNESYNDLSIFDQPTSTTPVQSQAKAAPTNSYNDLSIFDMPLGTTIPQGQGHPQTFMENLFSPGTAARMGFSAAGDQLGATLATAYPPLAWASYPLTSIAGGAYGEYQGQNLNNEPRNWWSVMTEGLMNPLFPGPNMPAKGAGMKAAADYIVGSGIAGAKQGIAGTVPRHWASEGIFNEEGGVNVPPLGEFAGQGVAGTALGATVGSAFLGGRAAYNAMPNIGHTASAPSPMPQPGQMDLLAGVPPRTDMTPLGQQELPFPTQNLGRGNPYEPYLPYSEPTQPNLPGMEIQGNLFPESTGTLLPGEQVLNAGRIGGQPPPPPTQGGVPVLPPGTLPNTGLPQTVVVGLDTNEIRMRENQGYVIIPGLTNADGKHIMVLKELAPLFKAQQPPAPVQTPTPVNRPEIAGPAGTGESLVGDTITVDRSKLTDAKRATIESSGYKLESLDAVKAIFRALRDDEGGWVDYQTMWQNLKRMFGRDPAPEEVERAMARQATEGEQTGRVADFPDEAARAQRQDDLNNTPNTQMSSDIFMPKPDDPHFIVETKNRLRRLLDLPNRTGQQMAELQHLKIIVEQYYGTRPPTGEPITRPGEGQPGLPLGTKITTDLNELIAGLPSPGSLIPPNTRSIIDITRDLDIKIRDEKNSIDAQRHLDEIQALIDRPDTTEGQKEWLDGVLEQAKDRVFEFNNRNPVMHDPEGQTNQIHARGNSYWVTRRGDPQPRGPYPSYQSAWDTIGYAPGSTAQVVRTGAETPIIGPRPVGSNDQPIMGQQDLPFGPTPVKPEKSFMDKTMQELDYEGAFIPGGRYGPRPRPLPPEGPQPTQLDLGIGPGGGRRRLTDMELSVGPEHVDWYNPIKGGENGPEWYDHPDKIGQITDKNEAIKVDVHWHKLAMDAWDKGDKINAKKYSDLADLAKERYDYLRKLENRQTNELSLSPEEKNMLRDLGLDNTVDEVAKKITESTNPNELLDIADHWNNKYREFEELGATGDADYANRMANMALKRFGELTGQDIPEISPKREPEKFTETPEQETARLKKEILDKLRKATEQPTTKKKIKDMSTPDIQKLYNRLVEASDEAKGKGYQQTHFRIEDLIAQLELELGNRGHDIPPRGTTDLPPGHKDVGDTRFVDLNQAIKRDTGLVEKERLKDIEKRVDRDGFAKDKYRLPDGTIVPVDATATKGAQTTDFTMRDGKIVKMEYVGPMKPDDKIDPRTGRVVEDKSKTDATKARREFEDTLEEVGELLQSGKNPKGLIEEIRERINQATDVETALRNLSDVRAHVDSTTGREKAIFENLYNDAHQKYYERIRVMDPDANMPLGDMVIKLRRLSKQRGPQAGKDLDKLTATFERRIKEETSLSMAKLSFDEMDTRVEAMYDRDGNLYKSHDEFEEQLVLSLRDIAREKYFELRAKDEAKNMPNSIKFNEGDTDKFSRQLLESLGQGRAYTRGQLDLPLGEINTGKIDVFSTKTGDLVQSFDSVGAAEDFINHHPQGKNLDWAPHDPSLNKVSGAPLEDQTLLDAMYNRKRQQDLPGIVSRSGVKAKPETIVIPGIRGGSGEGEKPIHPSRIVEKGHPVINLFRKNMKTVDNYDDTRFILPDGTRLRYKTGLSHGEGAKNIGANLKKAIKEGIIRFTSGGHSEIGAPITHAQADHLADSLNFNPDKFATMYIDVHKPNDSGIHTLRFHKEDDITGESIRERVNSILGGRNFDLKRFFSDETGAIPVADMAPGAMWKQAKQMMGWGQGERTPPRKKDDPPNLLREALAVPTGATTMLDASAPGRQGLALMYTPQFRRALVAMVRGASYSQFKQIDAELRSKDIMRPRFNEETGAVRKSFGEEEMKLKMFKPASEAPIGQRAEATASRWLEQIPLLGMPIRATNRMFITFLNHLNVNRAEFLVNRARDMSIKALDTGSAPMPGIMGSFGFTKKYGVEEALNLNPYHNTKLAREIGDFVNTATGHGPLRTHVLPFKGAELSLESAADALNMAMFSPGLFMSRVRMLNPNTYIMASPSVRKEYLKSAISMGVAWYAFTEMAKMAGGDEVTVNNDYTNADFGKVRIGNTRLDPGGGFLQFLVQIGRFIEGGSTSSANQQFQKFGEGFRAETQLSNAQRFMSNKLNPAAKFAYDLLNQSEYNPFHVYDRTAQLFVPLIAQDAIELYHENPDLMPWMAPVALGMGTQTYSKGESVGKLIAPENDWLAGGGGVEDLMRTEDYR
jgi:hypothetical protein